MRHLLIIISVFMFFSATPLSTLAQSATNSAQTTTAVIPKETPVTQEDKIKSLKERLATKVAEIRQNQKGVVWGVIKEITPTSAILITSKDDLTVTLSEDDTIIKEISSGKLIESTIKALKPDLHATIFGLIDAEEKKVDAKYLLLKVKTTVIVGTVTEKNANESTISIKTFNNEVYNIDVETSTRINTFTDNKIIKSGYSKITEGDRIHLRGSTTTAGDEKRLRAVGILHIPNSVFKTIPSPTPVSTPSATPKEEQ